MNKAKYTAAVLFLLMLAAFWCTEWLLGAVFAVLFLVCATLPHNMRIQYFNKRADKLENSFGKVVSVDLSEEDNLTLTISAPDQAESDGAAVPERAEASARVSEALRDKNARVVEIPYKYLQGLRVQPQLLSLPSDGKQRRAARRHYLR